MALAGLATGAALINGLAERYWDDLFPMPDEDGIYRAREDQARAAAQ